MSTPLTLDQAHVGDRLILTGITDPDTYASALRFGLSLGETVEIASKVPGGPIVIRRKALELALGRQLCRHIAVEKLDGSSNAS